MPGNIYSASEIIGKTLYGNQSVQLKRVGSDEAPVVFTVKAGEPIGTVYSFLEVKPGVRDSLYWMFYDTQQKPFYAKHREGLFSTSALHEQGAMSVQEQIEADKAKKENLKETILKVLKFGGIGLGAFMLLKALIEKAK